MHVLCYEPNTKHSKDKYQILPCSVKDLHILCIKTKEPLLLCIHSIKFCEMKIHDMKSRKGIKNCGCFYGWGDA